jgi:hypothetical protein
MPMIRDAALAAAVFFAGAGVAAAQVVPAPVASARPAPPVETVVAYVPTGSGPVYPAPTARRVYYNEPAAVFRSGQTCGANCVRAGF